MLETLQLGRTFGKCLGSLGSRKVGVKHSCCLRVIILMTIYDAGIAQESRRYLLRGPDVPCNEQNHPHGSGGSVGYFAVVSLQHAALAEVTVQEYMT